LDIIRHLELAAFQERIHLALRYLKIPRILQYEHITQTHKTLFASLYPWAGSDRLQNAPDIAIGKAGYQKLFAHPVDIRRAADYALKTAQKPGYLRARPGEIFGLLALSHPFLEGNGRTILTFYSELSRRNGFHVSWEEIAKDEFLETLTGELLQPGRALDSLVLRYLRQGVLTPSNTATRLEVNFNRK